MSISMGVFVDTEISLEELAKEVGELLGLKFEYQKDEYEEWYAVRTDEGLFDVVVNDAENDRDLNFEDYKYEVRFWENRDNPPEHREKLRNEIGKGIFESLKSTGKYSLMYVYDGQQKLDEYHPFETTVQAR